MQKENSISNRSLIAELLNPQHMSRFFLNIYFTECTSMDFSEKPPPKTQLIDEFLIEGWWCCWPMRSPWGFRQTTWQWIMFLQFPRQISLRWSFFCGEVAVVVLFLPFFTKKWQGTLQEKRHFLRFAGKKSHVFPCNSSNIWRRWQLFIHLGIAKGWDFWQVLRLMDMVFCIFFSLLAGLGFQCVLRGLQNCICQWKRWGLDVFLLFLF